MKGLLARIRESVGGWGSSLNHCVYGRIFPPCYCLGAELKSDIPEVFNSRGERMDIFFLRDRHLAFDPYSVYMPPSYWLWDRYNIGLKTHFYSHWEMLSTMGRPDRRYGMLIESSAITPTDYKIFKTHIGLEKDFDAIFTYDEQILDSVANARFAPFAACPWYGTKQSGVTSDDLAYAKKTKNVSMLSSNKMMCDLHKYRIQLALDCKKNGLADTFGTFDGGVRVNSIAEVLKDYRYSIMVENEISKYYFSERLTSCFVSMTVPIYCGATDIGSFFNCDGIIVIRPGDDPKRVLAQCSEADYQNRIHAILDNYQRVREYYNIWDWIYFRYLTVSSSVGK